MALIFDNAAVTKLVMDWQLDRDPDKLAEIVQKSMALIEALVSAYNSEFRDDLIQESVTKVIYAIRVFDPNMATLHTFLTTVIKNVCISWLSKYDKMYIDIDDVEILGKSDPSDADMKCMISDLKAFSRERFPSLQVEEIDAIIDMLVKHLQNGVQRNKSLSMIADVIGIDRALITTISAASIIYLRLYYGYGKATQIIQRDEFSLLPELRSLVGDDIYQRILVAFSGFTIKIP